MDALQIKAFIDAMASSDLAEMEVARDGWTLRLVRRPSGLPRTAATGMAMTAGTSASVAHSAVVEAPEAGTPATSADTVCAPLYGVVHLQPTPGEPPFVTPGLAIQAGQTLCVIEAMKVFNEVRAERDATIDAVLVASGQEVDAGQPLLRLR
ncbi:acetyl-CoA carboxylase biotin carboxyl carrier protein [Aquabacterium sp.]|uniref:acetyl-CoA carboxylase biotin carboxyl carrier protein n=1 Tax=Aquabacterium sp. TaxID=1872578 RepID=UPI002BEDA595|nr:acetyl-CoA carboxylase biotin carboxyl carrier protein subunit [Aquabacterium sp.]HSW03870.1 acetyl-CoA carboxylase biotin carboxyl carrier protein subunit [Aquabacterium sp.]